MINIISFNSVVKTFVAVVTIGVFSVAGVANAAISAASVPSCVITVAPNTINNGQTATLQWESTQGAVFASLDHGIGNIAPDGQMTVSPSTSLLYTMHTWNSQGDGGYCSVGLTVDGYGVITSVQPHVTLQTLAIHPASSGVTLGNVPYTGAAESALYTFFLLALLLTAGYTVTTQRKNIFA